MTMAAVATATTMTEPVLPSAAERLAALRAPSGKRTRPANTSKILAAGLSTTALFGLVTAMGWPSGAGSAPTTSAAMVEPAVAPLVPVAPAARGVPATAAPVVVPIVIPVAVPVARPAAQAAASNTTTKSSG